MRSCFKRLLNRRNLARAAFVLAVAITGVIAFYVITASRGRSAWEDYRADAIRRGARVQLPAAQPQIPAEHNFAATPFFEDLFREDAPRARPTSALPFPNDPGIPQPWGEPLTGEPLDLVKIRDFLARAGCLTDPTDDPARDILQGMERYAPVLAELHEAAKRPAASFPVKWEEGFSMRLPHLYAARRAASIFGLRAAAFLGAGDHAAAYQDLRDILRLYHAMEGEPILMSGAVRLAIFSRASTLAWEGLAKGKWTDEELAGLGEEFGRLRILHDWHAALQGERAVLNQELERISAGSDYDLALLFTIASATPDESIRVSWKTRLRAAFYPRGWLYDNMVLVNELFDERVSRIDLAAGIVKAGPNMDELVQRNTRQSPARYSVTQLLVPAFDRIEHLSMAAHTRAQQIEVACAIERHRMAAGGIPQTLAVLVPALLPSDPRDAADGQPLRYAAAPDGSYRIWSVALNRRDQGGQMVPGAEVLEQPDWVWHMPAR